MESDYNTRVHSSTGQSPDERFLQGLPAAHRRISDLQAFNALFLWRETRTVTKYGRMKLHGNQYPVTSRPHGSVVQVRYDPFDLKEVAIYDGKGTLLETNRVSKQLARQAPSIPQDSRKAARTISEDARRYFSRLREQHHQMQLQSQETPFSALLKEHPNTNESQQENTDACYGCWLISGSPTCRFPSTFAPRTVSPPGPITKPWPGFPSACWRKTSCFSPGR